MAGLHILSLVTANDRNTMLVIQIEKLKKEMKIIEQRLEHKTNELTESQRNVKLFQEREQLYCSRLVEADKYRDEINVKIKDSSTKYELLKYKYGQTQRKMQNKEDVNEQLLKLCNEKNQDIKKLQCKLHESSELTNVYQKMWDESYQIWQNQQSLIVKMRKSAEQNQNKIYELKADILKNKYNFQQNNEALKQQNESLKDVLFQSKMKESKLLKQIEDLKKQLRKDTVSSLDIKDFEL